MKIARLVVLMEKLVADNAPSLLTAVGVVGAISTAVLAGQASWKAALRIDESEYVPGEKTTKEKLQMCWKLYIPAVGTGTVTVAAILGANHISTRRAAGLAAAYTISEKAYSEYRDKIVEKLGSKSDQSVRDDIAQDRVTRTSEASREVVVVGTNSLCLEGMTGRYFNSSYELLRRAENDINYRIIHDGYATVSDFYALLDLPTTAYSDELGWSSDEPLALDIRSAITTDNRPCLHFDYSSAPIRDYMKFH